VKELKISELSLSYVVCVGGRTTLIGQDISNTQTIWQLSAEDEKSIPPLNIDILLEHD
jgi:hypothetical protein